MSRASTDIRIDGHVKGRALIMREGSAKWMTNARARDSTLLSSRSASSDAVAARKE